MLKATMKTKTPNVFRFVGTGDWHIGHPSTRSEDIISALYRMFPDNEVTASLDLIIIEGDVYDHDLYLYSKDEELFKEFRKYLLTLSVKYDIPVRVLEGTPDHDWHQSRSFIIDNALLELGADVRYVDTVEIEYLERYDMHILYVPDEFRPKTDDVWLAVEAALRRHNLTKVDICVMHGCFPHQLPKLEGKIQMHDPKRYIGITNYYIVIGHIHMPSQYECILGPGSIERLIHGDEGDKGYIRVSIDLLNRNDKIEFIKNPSATPYVTLNMAGLDADDVMATVVANVEKYNHYPSIHFRIKAKPSDVATSMYNQITKLYPGINWKFKSIDDNNGGGQLVHVLEDKRKILTRPSLTKDNIADVLTDRIRLKKPHLADTCHNLLKEIVNGYHS